LKKSQNFSNFSSFFVPVSLIDHFSQVSALMFFFGIIGLVKCNIDRDEINKALNKNLDEEVESKNHITLYVSALSSKGKWSFEIKISSLCNWHFYIRFIFPKHL
jgi:hypothetical protein